MNKKLKSLLLLIPMLLLVFASGCKVKKTEKPVVGKEYNSSRTKDGLMVFVPAGDFMMGCNEQVDKQCAKEERPYHKVYLDAFYIDKFLVTQGDYNECVNSGKCSANEKLNHFSGDRQPLVGVTWNDANTYCKWAGKRLPTEAQWEKAARGTDGRVYPWGNSIDTTKANYDDSKMGKTSDVGSYPSGASPYGALDMAGNVWQWVSDFYDAKYYGNSPSKNPKGPDSGNDHVLRGGCCSHTYFLRVLDRKYVSLDQGTGLKGFRCARD